LSVNNCIRVQIHEIVTGNGLPDFLCVVWKNVGVVLAVFPAEIFNFVVTIAE